MKSLIQKLFFVVAVAAAPMTCDAQEEPTILSEGAKVYVKIEQSPDLTGQLLEMEKVKVSASFGDVDVPMEKVDGIKMNFGSEGMAVIAFKNGDMITGKITMSELLLKTNWGKAHIDPIHIETITMDKDGRFFKDGPKGTGGWRFSKAVELPANTRQPRRATPNTTTLPRQFGQ